MDLNSPYICHTCLSLDRRLYPLTNFSPLIQLNFLPTTAKMCWECGNIVLKFSNFITKAVTAQGILMDVQQNDDIVCLSTLEFSRHQPLYEFKHIDDKISEQDSEETISVKEEIFSSNTENEMYHEDTEQINYNTHDDVEENSEKDITNDENDVKSMLNVEINFDVKVETENVQEKPEITWTKKREALLDAENRFLEVPEEVMKKILVTELTDDEVLKKREQKRSKLQNVTYKCDFCIIGFTTLENLNKHIRSAHRHIDYNNLNAPADLVRDCEMCKRRFKTKYLAQKHRERHYIEYECRLCQYRAYELSVIVAHCNKNHDNEPVGQTVCDLCPVVSSFRTPEEYFGHWKLEHSSCELCGHTSRTKGSLQRHMKRMHKQREKLICDHCSKCFKSKSQLEIHMSTHDANIAKALSYCDICKIQFKRVCYYRNHLKTSANHVKERLQCSECDKQFVTEFFRKRHYKFYHLKKSEHKCDECNKMFITEWRLKDHQRIHHGLKKPRNYECNDCGKKFYNRTILKKHYSVHSDLRPFMCSECGDTFKHSAALYTHTKLVHRLGNKLYKKQKKIIE